MTDESEQFNVSATASRPSFLPLFVFGRNNLNPELVTNEDGLVVRVVRANRLKWNEISRVDVRTGLRNTYAVITHNKKWDYIAHFRDPEELRRLVGELHAHGVSLTSAAANFLATGD